MLNEKDAHLQEKLVLMHERNSAISLRDSVQLEKEVIEEENQTWKKMSKELKK